MDMEKKTTQKRCKTTTTKKEKYFMIMGAGNMAEFGRPVIDSVGSPLRIGPI